MKYYYGFMLLLYAYIGITMCSTHYYLKANDYYIESTECSLLYTGQYEKIDSLQALAKYYKKRGDDVKSLIPKFIRP